MMELLTEVVRAIRQLDPKASLVNGVKNGELVELLVFLGRQWQQRDAAVDQILNQRQFDASRIRDIATRLCVAYKEEHFEPQEEKSGHPDFRCTLCHRDLNDSRNMLDCRCDHVKELGEARAALAALEGEMAVLRKWALEAQNEVQAFLVGCGPWLDREGAGQWIDHLRKALSIEWTGLNDKKMPLPGSTEGQALFERMHDVLRRCRPHIVMAPSLTSGRDFRETVERLLEDLDRALAETGR